MDDSDLLAFTPVQLRSRRDGWTPPRQHGFILALDKGLKPGAAAAAVGLSRKSAYALRSRAGGEGFAAAWDAAVARARRRRMDARKPSLAQRALEGEWHPRLVEGRLVGWTHKSASARLLGLQKRLDKKLGHGPDLLTDEHLAALDSILRGGR